jgi:SAM-dependent methyltransferase
VDVTNRFVLDFANQYALGHPGAAVLDYGCGAGELVAAGRAAGLDLLGADIFYGGSSVRQEAERTGRLGTCVHEIIGHTLPFAEGSFDLVANNQVLEHVEEMDAVLREIHRVLKPGGTVLSIFPSRDVFREGHIGIPFVHWFGPGSRARFLYTWMLRAAGLGTWKEQAPTARKWTTDKLRWLDLYTRYRSRREITDTFRRYFTSEFRELDYIRYRMLDNPRLARFVRLLRLPGVPAVAVPLFRKLAFLVIVSRKAAA